MYQQEYYTIQPMIWKPQGKNSSERTLSSCFKFFTKQAEILTVILCRSELLKNQIGEDGLGDSSSEHAKEIWNWIASKRNDSKRNQKVFSNGSKAIDFSR